MIYDTSYTDKETTKAINQAVGNSFSFKERWKMGGIGSRRMQITKISENYKNLLNAAHYVTNANIELRPKGIIIHFRHKLQAYSWVMPYASLVVEDHPSLVLKSTDGFVVFQQPIDEKFVKKLLLYKNI
ncbi:MAG: hypothetical protein Tsb0034_01370 [Ekhidna sp.]